MCAITGFTTILVIVSVLLVVHCRTVRQSYYDDYPDAQSYHQPGYQQNYQQQYQQDYNVAPPKKLRSKDREQKQDFSKIPGVAGVDYPIFHKVPPTSFSCENVPALPGMYANIETGCQAYHVCHDGREGKQGASFLCTNGTIFNQAEFACDWWYNVNCHDAPNLYKLNLYPEKNPYTAKKHAEEQANQVRPEYY